MTLKYSPSHYINVLSWILFLFQGNIFSIVNITAIPCWGTKEADMEICLECFTHRFPSLIINFMTWTDSVCRQPLFHCIAAATLHHTWMFVMSCPVAEEPVLSPQSSCHYCVLLFQEREVTTLDDGATILPSVIGVKWKPRHSEQQ